MLFKSAVVLISEKKHLTLEGIKEIISFRATMNLGLTDTLKVFQMLYLKKDL